MDKIGLDVLSGELGNLVRVYWNQSLSGSRGTYGRYQVRSNGPLPQQGFVTQGDVSTTNIGLFVQDSWTIGRRLTLNLGLRTENEKVPTFVPDDPSVPEYAIEWGFGKKLAPRARLRLGRPGRRQDEGLRLLGRLLRHLQAADAPGLLRWRQVAGVLLHAGQR